MVTDDPIEAEPSTGASTVRPGLAADAPDTPQSTHSTTATNKANLAIRATRICAILIIRITYLLRYPRVIPGGPGIKLRVRRRALVGVVLCRALSWLGEVDPRI